MDEVQSGEAAWTPSTLSPRATIGWAALAAIGAFIVFFGGSYPGISTPATRIVTQTCTLIVLGAWCALALVRERWRPDDALIGPVAVGLGGALIATIGSQRPALSIEALLTGAAAAAAFFFLRTLMADPRFRARIGGILALVPILVATAYVVQIGLACAVWIQVGAPGLPPLRPPTGALVPAVPEALATVIGSINLGAPNLTAAVVILLGPWSVVAAARLGLGRAIVVGAVLASAVILSASRGAEVGAVAGTAVTLAFLVRSEDFSRRLRALQQRRPIAMRMATVCAIGGGGIAAAVAFGRFVGSDDSTRLSLWGATVRLIEAHPILGTGPGTWAQLKMAVTPPGAVNVVQYHAHDTYLQTLSDVGVVGSAALVVVAVAVVRRLLQALRVDDPGVRATAAAAIVGLVAAAAHGITDHFLNLPTYTLAVVALVALVDSGLIAQRGRGQPVQKGSASRVAVIACLVTIVVSIPTIVAAGRADLAAVRGNTAADRGDWFTAAEEYRAARDLVPGLTIYRLEAAIADAHLGRPEARMELAEAVAEDPLPQHLLSLAMLELRAGDPEDAFSHATLAAARTAGEPMILLNLGFVAEKTGRPTTALEAYAQAVALDPELAAATFFREHDRINGLAVVVRAARDLLAAEGAPINAALVRGYGGDFIGAMTELTGLQASDPRDVASAQLDWLAGRTSEAIARLEIVAHRSPTDSGAVAWLHRYGQALGDDGLANRYGQWLNIVGWGSTFATGVFGSAISSTPEDAGSGMPYAYPAAVYLRNGPADFLGPGVLSIAPRVAPSAGRPTP